MLRITIFLKRVVFSIRRYLFSSFFDLLDLLTQIFVFIAIVVWIKIINDEVHREFNIEENINKMDIYIFDKLENFSINYDFYVKIQSFAVFLIVLQLFKFLYFAPQIEKLLNILTSAQKDLIFFVVMFAMVSILGDLKGFFEILINIYIIYIVSARLRNFGFLHIWNKFATI